MSGPILLCNGQWLYGLDHPSDNKIVQYCMDDIFKSIAAYIAHLISCNELENRQLLTIEVKVHRQEVEETN